VVFAAAERLAARWADAIVCVCDYERRLALKKRVARPDQLHVVHNGVHDIGPKLRADPGGEPVRLVSIARFESPKDHGTLLAALSTLRDDKWELELVGDGPREDAIRRLAAELGIARRVRFAGYRTDPAETLARAHVFVLSSRSEGFPRSILEGMRAGLPVVATDVGGVGEAVLDGGTGRLVPPASQTVLAEILKTLIVSGPERERLGTAGRLRYEAKFTFERMLSSTAALYATIVEQGKTPTRKA
jgi:glycosyltransferase involved in cell wall biosynthesis